MLPKAARLWALVCLALALQLAAAQNFQLVRRQDGGAKPTPAPTSPQTGAAKPDGSSNTGKNRESATTGTDAKGSNTASPTDPSTASQSTPTTAAATTTSIGPVVDPKFLNVTIPDGQLPLAPEITPAWAVAGVIMLITGIIYTLVGIKNRWIHTFFSTSYITALGVAVLIVYVMSVPVGNAVQGGYVVAVVMSGCAVGAASVFFKELTEGLGCALGGFCVSMWLLCLVPGGLLRPVASKAAFIAVFTIVGFAFYFSRWTRDWTLIAMISFAGATVTVLGLDCFSRAGLKEFWAYVWDVNVNLFPLGADTYPVTKGIRVETAAIVIIFLMGIISQIKLWRVVREKRDKRAAERALDRRDLEVEEENVGRQVEEANTRDRRQWERVYGNGTIDSGTDSLGDGGSEKKLKGGRNGSYKLRSSVEGIEMADMSESDQSRNGQNALLSAEEARDGKVTVRVGADEVPQTPTDIGDELDEMAAGMSEKQDASTASKRLSQRTTTSKRVSQAQTVTEAPEVVPLPFSVPADDEAKSQGDRSSIATFADDAEAPAPARHQRHSLVKRLSASILRGFSQRSGRGDDDVSPENGESSEELVIPKAPRHDKDNASLAATVDVESISGGDRHSIHTTGSRRSIEINAKLAKTESQESAAAPPPQASHEAVPASQDNTPQALSPDVANAPVERHSRVVLADEGLPEPSDKPKSTISAASTRVSLTKDRLPNSLSRVAMSYRTNEWAKHLSYAELPEPDELRANQPAQSVKTAKERSVPVNVVELQKTAEDGAPPPAIMRSESRASNISFVQSVSRRVSKADASPHVLSPTYAPPQDKDSQARNISSASATLGQAGCVRSASSAAVRRSASGFKPIVEHAAAVAEPIPEENTETRPVSVSLSLASNEAPSQRTPVPGLVSYASPQTLIGQREMFLRSRSQGSLIAGAPEPVLSPGSDGASLYSNPAYAAALISAADPDDIPLSQRKQIMRQSSLMSLPQSNSSNTRLPSAGSGYASSENLTFNSHQPKRASTLPPQVVREAQLANFRQSVQQDLRAGTPIIAQSTRESPFTPSSLLGNRESEVQRNIEMQRNVLMGQKEAEAQRKEVQRREKEFADRAFDERMRSGDLLEAHREAMRKMQKGARNRPRT